MAGNDYIKQIMNDTPVHLTLNIPRNRGSGDDLHGFTMIVTHFGPYNGGVS